MSARVADEAPRGAEEGPPEPRPGVAALVGGRLSGRVVLVTGGSRNLGAEIARVMAEAGAVLAVNHRASPDDAAAVVASLPGTGHLAVAGDVSCEEGVDQVVSTVERTTRAHVSVLVNNVGPFSLTPFADLPVHEFDAIWNANVRSAYLAARRVAGAMRSAGWGRVVNLSAGSAFGRDHSVYSLAKAAVITLTECLATELGPEVTVNCVAPGQIAESADEISEIDPGFVTRTLARTPAGRLVSRREVAELVALCVGPVFDAVTGATIPADGGARLPRS